MWRVVRSVAALVAAAAAVGVVVDVVQTRSDSGEVASEVDNKYPSMVVRTGADPADNITWTYTARLAPTGWCDEMREMIYKERDRIDREEEIFFAQMESQYCDRLR